MKKNYILKTNYKIRNIVLLLVGLFTSAYIASYILGLSGTLEFLDEKKFVLNSLPYISGNIEVEEDDVYKVLDNKILLTLIPKHFEYYNYLVLNISSDTENGSITLKRYDDFGSICETIPIYLSNKEQVIQFTDASNSAILLECENMEGDTFRISKMQLCSQIPFDKWEIFFMLFLGCMVCYLAVIVVLLRFISYKKIKLDFYKITNIFVLLYESINNRLLKVIKYRNKSFDYVKTGIIVIIVSAIFYKMYSTSYYENYNELVIFIGISLLVVAKFLSKESCVKIKWHNPLALSWLLLSIIMICSEIITTQKMGLVGYFNIIILGILFYVLGNNKNREKLIECLKIVILCTFIPVIIKCLFFYSNVQGIVRYSGIYGNANQFASYVIVVFSVILSEIDFYLEIEKFRFRVVVDIILLGFSSCFLWLTQSRTTMLAMLAIIFFELIKIIIMRKNYINILKNLLIVFLMIIIIPLIWKISLLSINNISLKDSTNKIVVENMEMPINLSMTVYASKNENRIVNTLKEATSLKQLSNGRLEFWITHFRNMNLTGHKDYLYMESLGDVSPSHNSIIGMMYKYGIFAGIPYIIMLFYSFWYALKYFINNSFKRKNAMLPLNIVIAFIMCAMLDTMDERPFWKMLWLVYYIMIGFLMNTENDDKTNDSTAFNEESCLGENKLNLNRLEKHTITVILALFILVHVIKFVYLGVDWWNSRIPQDSIYAEIISDEILKSAPLGLNDIVNCNQWDFEEEIIQNQFQSYNPEYVECDGINFVYYQDVKSKQIKLAASLDGDEWEVYNKPVLMLGESGTFDSKSIIQTDVVYAAPYFYMFYIGESSNGSTGIGIAVSEDGVNWTKKNVRGTFKEENIKDIHAEYNMQNEIIQLTYINDKSNIKEAAINISQNRDMTQFDTESDWTTSLVSSENILNGSYAIEGETGTKNVWMQSESSIDLYYKKESAIININGYMPLEQYLQKNIDSVNLTVKINGQSVYEKIFKESEVFDIQIPIDTIDKKGEDYMHIELITDADFNPKELGGSEDGRDLSYILYNIKQE